MLHNKCTSDVKKLKIVQLLFLWRMFVRRASLFSYIFISALWYIFLGCSGNPHLVLCHICQYILESTRYDIMLHIYFNHARYRNSLHRSVVFGSDVGMCLTRTTCICSIIKPWGGSVAAGDVLSARFVTRGDNINAALATNTAPTASLSPSSAL